MKQIALLTSLLFLSSLMPAPANAIFFIPDELRFKNLSLPDEISISEVQLKTAWRSESASGRFKGTLDSEALLLLNLESMDVWNSLVSCNEGSVAKARESYRSGKLCPNANDRKSLEVVMKNVHRSLGQTLQTSEIQSVTLPVYEQNSERRQTLSLPLMHPFFMQMLLERIAYSADHDGKQQLVAIPGDSETPTMIESGAGTTLVKAAPGKQAIFHALVLLLQSSSGCQNRGLWPRLEYPVIDTFRDRMDDRNVIGFRGALLVYFNECRSSRSQDLSHYLFNRNRYRNAFSSLWSRWY